MASNAPSNGWTENFKQGSVNIAKGVGVLAIVGYISWAVAKCISDPSGVMESIGDKIAD